MLVVHSLNPLVNVYVGLSYTYHRDGQAPVGKVPNQRSPTPLVRESGGAEDTATTPPKVPLLQTRTPLRFRYLVQEVQPTRGPPALVPVLLTTRETLRV